MSLYIRSHNIKKLYYWSKNIYQRYFKTNTPWGLSRKDLIKYPSGSIGFELGKFLVKHNFIVEPKLENHDLFHTLTGTGISIPEEIALQYYLLGNGKSSLYLTMVILSGTLFYPEKWIMFYQYYMQGSKSKKFYHLDYQKILTTPINTFRNCYKITKVKV